MLDALTAAEIPTTGTKEHKRDIAPTIEMNEVNTDTALTAVAAKIVFMQPSIWIIMSNQALARVSAFWRTYMTLLFRDFCSKAIDSRD